MQGSSNLEPLLIRLYLDHHIWPRLVSDLRNHGFDALATSEVGFERALDEDQLAFAATHGRAILTYNIADFAELHRQWVAEQRPHAGIIVSRQPHARAYGGFLARVLRLLNALSAEEIANSFIHLEQFK